MEVELSAREYIPIQCGSAVADRRLRMLGDDACTPAGKNLSISYKNACYSELTGLYWIWKHQCHDGESIIGLCHYRRFFDFHNRHFFSFGVIRKNRAALNNFNFSIPKQVADAVRNGKIIVPRVRRFAMTNRKAILSSVPEKIMRHFESFFLSCQTESYQKAYHEVMFRRHYLMANNMFVMSGKDINAYCQWLFPLFEEYEKKINVNTLKDRHFRLFGYLAERLFNVWLLAEQKELVHYPLVWFDDKPLHHTPLLYKVKTGLQMLWK